MGVECPQVCEDCGSSLASGQRYCLECGSRVGSRSAALEALIARALSASGAGDGNGSADPGAGAATVTAAGAAAAAGGATAATDLRLPPPRISALLVLVFLGFGMLLGHVARAPVSDTLASTRSPVRVVLPASQPATASTAPGPSSSASSNSESASEPPTPESEATPEPASGGSTTPKKSSSKAGGSSGSKGSASGGGEQGTNGSSSSGSSQPAAGTPAKKLPAIKHVFVIMLSDEPYASAFGPSSTATYLSSTLEHQGELLTRFDAVAHEELANEAALFSGQGPTAETVANCPNYTEITPTSVGADEQVLGSGCVYPRSTLTLAGELTAKHLTWKAYLQATDEGAGTPGACSHPALGQADPTANQAASSGVHATFRNPVVYFASIVDSPECVADDVGLSKLSGDLARANSTPSFAYIIPDRCHDGNPTPCTATAPAGMAPADGFLKQVVQEIMASTAYKESGLLVITTDEAPSSGEFADSSSCCGQPLFPNAPARTVAGAPRGGGTVGALLLSPYIKGATTNEEPFNDFSLLRTIDQLFALKPLGYAALPAVKPFEPSMFLASKG